MAMCEGVIVDVVSKGSLLRKLEVRTTLSASADRVVLNVNCSEVRG
jgi:hypothetical protein